jgi:hypothetical protein
MNPESLRDEAARLYEGFHWGRPARRRSSVELPPRPRELVELGTLEAITYGTRKGSEGLQHYEHAFGETGRAKPRLAMDARTKRLHIVGGGYDVEDRGIVG